MRAHLIDQPHRKVRFLVVESGGFLGIGEKKTLIPVDAITQITDTNVLIDQTREHVSGAPAYDPSLTTERTFYGDVYSHYGHTPYWTSGYISPSYPFYPV